MQKLFIHLLFLSLVLTTTSCAKKEIDQIAEAQACLDASTPDTAMACIQKIEGLDTEAANLIRCSAVFIYQEFASPSRLIQISDQMQNSNGSTAAAIGFLAFTKGTSVEADAMSGDALNFCLKAKSKGMVLLASMARIATALTAIGGSTVVTDCGGENADPTACQAAVESVVCNPATPAPVLGAAALAAYQQSCIGGAQSASEMCQQFALASQNGTADPTTVGDSMKDQIKGTGGCP